MCQFAVPIWANLPTRLQQEMTSYFSVSLSTVPWQRNLSRTVKLTVWTHLFERVTVTLGKTDVRFILTLNADHEYCTKDGGWRDGKWACTWPPRLPIGECSLLGGVGMPAALWQTYHSLNLVWCESGKLGWGWTGRVGLDADDTGFDGVKGCTGLMSTGLDNASSLLWLSSSDS